jgi:hypothetical protein
VLPDPPKVLPVVIVPEVVVVELTDPVVEVVEVTAPEVTDPDVEVVAELADQYKSLLIEPEPGLITLPAVERAERPL